RELGRGLSQAYLSQIESGSRPHLTHTTRDLLARFFKVYPGFLVDDPEGYTSGLQSHLRAEDAKIDSWLFAGAEHFSADPPLSVAPFFAGAVHIHFPFNLYPPAHARHHGGASRTSHSGAYISWLNASTAMAFLAWFGGTGYILTRTSNLMAIVSLGIAIFAGL